MLSTIAAPPILKPRSAHWCSREYVAEVFRGKRVAIVGSGPGVLANKPGFVDSHDVVVRVNNWKLNERTGRRTDVFYSFFGSSIRKTAAECKASGVKLCIAKCPNAKFMDSPWHIKHGKTNGTDFRYIYEARADWWFCPVYVPALDEFMAHFNLLGGHVPTTGFAALLDVLEFEPARVYLTGFDFFSSGLHNVNERWRPINGDDPIGHRPALEARWLADNMHRLPVSVDVKVERALQRMNIVRQGWAKKRLAAQQAPA